MKWHLILPGLLVCSITSFAQVGIGTTSPNSKSILDLTSTTTGLLIPRMTQTERLAMSLTANEIGMLIYQTSPTKGVYSYDGSFWKLHAPLVSGTSDNQTLRWSSASGGSWVAESNIYNGGGSIGIGTVGYLTPTEKLHINSGGSDARIRFTNAGTGVMAGDGLFFGVLASSGNAQLIHNGAKPLIFGTSASERMRIDPSGNVGINKNNPTTTLDVNGTARIGANGSELTGIIRASIMIDIPPMAADTECVYVASVPNVVEGATVYVSPSAAISNVMIAYARVSSPGNVEIKFMNIDALPVDPTALMFYITVIQ